MAGSNSSSTTDLYTALLLARAGPIADHALALYRTADKAISRRVFDFFASLNVPLRLSPALKDLPFITSPTPVILACALYFLIVASGLFFIKITGAKPREKDPLLLRLFVLVHNFFLFALSLYMCVGIWYEVAKNGYSVFRNGYKVDELPLARLIYIFYVSKMYEFFDTFIMLLKRNTRQITVLHVYHHGSIALIWWLICHHAPGGDAYFSAALNSFVHVWMYLYYLLSALVGKNEKTRAKYLWWGKYLTQLQMAQFCANMLQAWIDNNTDPEPYPRFCTEILFYYMITLLVLFANFYVKKYLTGGGKPKRVGREKKKQ